MAALLENGSATGSAVAWGGGQGLFTAEGTFSGATIKLQYQSDNGTWLDAGSDTELTANGGGRFFLPVTSVRVNISGGPPSAVYSYVELFSI